jgi:hypothetical protein
VVTVCSEVVLQAELDAAWVFGGVDSANGWGADGGIGVVEVRFIEGVEGFDAELESVAFPGHSEGARNHHVDILTTGPDDEAAAGIGDYAGGAGDDEACVEVAVDGAFRLGEVGVTDPIATNGTAEVLIVDVDGVANG